MLFPGAYRALLQTGLKEDSFFYMCTRLCCSTTLSTKRPQGVPTASMMTKSISLSSPVHILEQLSVQLRQKSLLDILGARYVLIFH